MSLLAPVSIGELIDKITILEIKKDKIKNPDALQNIQKELALLNILNTWPKIKTHELYNVNLEIWGVEDELRELEKVKNFGPEFVALARSVYILNDKRAYIKRNMNIEFNSNIIEEKSYQ
jgi:hypothetical protein